jgi:hypothetical protein
MPEHGPMTLNFKPFQQPTTDADFTYKITPNTISIADTKRGRRSVTEDIEAVLRKIEYWHLGSITAFKIMYRDEHGLWDGVKWDGQSASFFALGETDEAKALTKLVKPICRRGKSNRSHQFDAFVDRRY